MPRSIMLVDDKARLASSYKDFVCKVFKFGSSYQSAKPVRTTRPGMASHAAPELLSKVGAKLVKSSPTQDIPFESLPCYQCARSGREWSPMPCLSCCPR